MATGLTRERTCLVCLVRFITRNARQTTCGGACKKRQERGQAANPAEFEAKRQQVIATWDSDNDLARLRWWTARELEAFRGWQRWDVQRRAAAKQRTLAAAA